MNSPHIPHSTFLAYLGILCFIPLLLHKENRFVQFHVKQGIALLMLEILCVIITSSFFIPAISLVLFLGCLILSVMGVIAITQKKETPIPVLHWMVEKFNI